MTMLDDFGDDWPGQFPAAPDLSIRDDIRRAGAEVYTGFDYPETDALIQKLEEHGLKVVRL